MRMLARLLFPNLKKLDQAISKLTEIRDSYRALNVEIYGEELAQVLNDW